MTREAVALFFAIHTLVVWAAVPLRIDQFPLTWAPMYAAERAADGGRAVVVLKDKARLERQGWRATRADGSEEWVRRADLNVPRRSAWRLYYERSWDEDPMFYEQRNSGGATFDRWLLGVPPGAAIVHEDWQRRLITSINVTLDRAPGDADFLVRLHAERERMEFEPVTLAKTGASHEQVEIRWRSEWSARFPDD